MGEQRFLYEDALQLRLLRLLQIKQVLPSFFGLFLILLGELTLETVDRPHRTRGLFINRSVLPGLIYYYANRPLPVPPATKDL